MAKTDGSLLEGDGLVKLYGDYQAVASLETHPALAVVACYAQATVVQCFGEAGAVQCGFCTPGMIMAAEALLRKTPHPQEAEIREAISGNLCRCTGYENIFRAVKKTMLRHLGKFEEAEKVNSQGITEYPEPMPFK